MQKLSAPLWERGAGLQLVARLRSSDYKSVFRSCLNLNNNIGVDPKVVCHTERSELTVDARRD